MVGEESTAVAWVAAEMPRIPCKKCTHQKNKEGNDYVDRTKRKTVALGLFKEA